MTVNPPSSISLGTHNAPSFLRDVGPPNSFRS
jgi:hypothetical protein